MNNIKVKSRNRLENIHLDHLMRVKLYLNAGRTGLHKAYTMWKEQKVRRGKLKSYCHFSV